MSGPWFAAAPMQSVTIVQGLRNALPNADIRQAEGAPIEGDDESGIPAAVAAARDMDIVILAIGETKEISGEAHSRGRIAACQAVSAHSRKRSWLSASRPS